MPSRENRYHERLQQYWEKIKGSHELPRESDINPDELDDIWPSCFLISIDDVTRRHGYRYSYLGTELVEAYGDDISNPDLVLKTATPMVKKFDEVVEHKRPVIDESEFINVRNLNIRYRACMLPLGRANGEVSHIIGCMRWKAY